VGFKLILLRVDQWFFFALLLVKEMPRGTRLGPNASIQETLEKLKRSTQKLERMSAKMGKQGGDPDLARQVSKEITVAKEHCTTLLKFFKKQTSEEDKAVMKKYTQQFETELERFLQVSKVCEQMTAQANTSQHNSSGGYQAEDFGAQQAVRQNREADLQEQALDIRFLELDDQEVERRAQDVDNVYRDITTVNEIFKDFLLLVNEQQETLDMIEDNIIETKDHTEAGADQLLKAEALQKKARKKSCCVIMLLVIVLTGTVLGVLFATK